MDNKISYIIDNIISILEFISLENITNLRNTNKKEFETIIESKFNTFVDEYYAIYKLLISGNDIEPLLKMLKSLEAIKKKY